MLYLKFLRKNAYRSILGVILTLGVLTPAIVFGAIGFDRPAGSELTSPVSMTLTIDDFSDFTDFPSGTNYYMLEAEAFIDEVNTDFYGEICNSSTTLSVIDQISFPIGAEVNYISAKGYTDDLCTDPYTGQQDLEGTGSEVLFTIIAGSSSIVNLPDNFISSTTAYVGRLFTDTQAVILVGLGLPVGFWIIRKILLLVK